MSIVMAGLAFEGIGLGCRVEVREGKTVLIR